MLAAAGIDPETFLQEYWQRKPLLIRGALQNFRPPISADELAGLALESSVESRIIEQVNGAWQLHHGPFKTADFQRHAPWTLLVQGVDQYLPEVAALRRLADFIPRWRVDDVMVSYAVAGGSAGPHYDNYDVFLLQGEGQRRWQLGAQCDQHSALIPHDELKILRDFSCDTEYTLVCGDLLYLPPGIAHWGVASTECTTFSIGFRAPRMTDLLSRWVDQVLETQSGEPLYADPGRALTRRPGEITTGDVERAIAQAQALLAGDSDRRWFGELVTEPRNGVQLGDDEDAQSRSPLARATLIELDCTARVAWQESGETVPDISMPDISMPDIPMPDISMPDISMPDISMRDISMPATCLPATITVFANGNSASFSGEYLPLVVTLCAQEPVRGAILTQALDAAAPLMNFLLDNGCLNVVTD